MSCIFDFVLVRAPVHELRAQLSAVTASFGAVEVNDVLSGAYRLNPKRGTDWAASVHVARELSRIFEAALLGLWNDQISMDHGLLFEAGELKQTFGVPLDERGNRVEHGPRFDSEDVEGIAMISALDQFLPGHGLDHDDLLELFGFKVYGLD